MAHLEQGTTIAGYRIDMLVGEGSSGVVYAAHEPGLERRVALKILAPELTRDGRFRERFLRESRVAASLEHASIIPIYAAGEADGQLYLAMRFVDGSDLGGLIEREGRLDPERALAILSQVAEALDSAHALGLVHRDVKPGNILVATGDRAYLCDFGLAKHAATASSLSRETAFSGTVHYVAPEIIQGGDVDGRADQYALACVLYESLTGEPPFRRDSELAVVLAHLRDKPAPLSIMRPDVGESLDAVVERALAKERDERYRSCAEFVADAGDALGGATPTRAGTAQLRTFLIADVRGYTRYTQEHGDEAGAALAKAFAALAEEVVRDHDGRLIELRGDEALAVFESTRNALRAALALQRRVEDEALPRGVGIGLDAGEAVPVGSGYRGGALNMAARLCSLAGPGEVIASEAVMHLARHVDGARYLQGRVERLKGIDRPVRVVEVVPAQSADELVRRLRRRLRGRRWVPVAALAVLLTAAAIVGAVLALGGDGIAAEPQTVGLFDAESHELVAAVDVGDDPGDVYYANGSVWTGLMDGTLVKIDPRTRRVVRKLALGPSRGFTVARDAVWWTSSEEPEILRVDPTYFTVERIPLSERGIPAGYSTTAEGVAVGAGSVWVARSTRVERLEPASGRVRRTFPMDFPQWIRFAEGSVYVSSGLTGLVYKIDPATNSIAWRTRVRPGINDLIRAGGFVWAVLGGEDAVVKLRESDGQQLERIAVSGNPQAITAGDGAVWVSSPRNATLTRIDLVNDAKTSFASGRAPTGLAEQDGNLWIGLVPSPQDELATVTGDVARLTANDNPLFEGQVDPATAWGLRQWELEYATQAKLYNYPDKPAPAGAQLVPEVAASIPDVSADGLTYRIRVRPGFRFSPPSGAPVTAETFRYSIERALAPTLGDFAPAHIYVGDIAGVDAFRAGRTRRLSGLSAQGDTLTIQVTRPVPDLPSRLAMPFFSAVPLGTPARVIDYPIPSAGPYYLASNNWYIVLKRNPNYGGDRPQRLDGIVYEIEVDPGEAAERVRRGEVDYVTAPFPDPGALIPSGEIARRYRAARPGEPRWLALPRPGIRYLRLNTRSGLFRSAELRRAVNYAIDRRALAGVNGERVTDQYLPPTMPGVSRTPVYRLDGPDLARARALARGRSGRAVLYTCTRPDCTERARIVKANLAAIGITVVVRAFEDAYGQGPRFDIRDDSWYVDQYDPSDILQHVLFGDNERINPNRYDEPAARRKVEAAAQLSGPDRFEAFGRAAREIAERFAPLAAYSEQLDPAFVSARLGCLVDVPAYAGLDLAALCLRDLD